MAVANARNAAQFAGLSPEEFVQALLIRYDPGAGIGWHRDRPVFEHVLGVSLEAPATMRFQRRKPGGFDRASANLPPRAMHHLSGEARHRWEYSIAEMAMTRWSITFRSPSEKGRRHSGEIYRGDQVRLEIPCLHLDRIDVKVGYLCRDRHYAERTVGT